MCMRAQFFLFCPSMEIYSDEYFMQKALEQASIAADSGEVPVGAIMVCNKQIIAKSYNQTEMLNDVTAHAEMLAITSAANFLGTKYLHNCELFVTLEPCPMCAGALKWAQIGRLVYGAPDDKKGFMNYGREILHPSTSVAFGLKHLDCAHILQEFFKQKR